MVLQKKNLHLLKQNYENNLKSVPAVVSQNRLSDETERTAEAK